MNPRAIRVNVHGAWAIPLQSSASATVPGHRPLSRPSAQNPTPPRPARRAVATSVVASAGVVVMSMSLRPSMKVTAVRRRTSAGSLPGHSPSSWLRAVALVAALASLTINFGLIDLIDGFTGYVDQERNQILDLVGVRCSA